MALVVFLSGIYLALVTGAAGEFLMLVTSFGGLGATVGSSIGMVVRWRARRKHLSPWDPPPDPGTRYLELGGVAGLAIGLILALLDAFVFA